MFVLGAIAGACFGILATALLITAAASDLHIRLAEALGD